MNENLLVYQANSFYNAFIALEQLAPPDEMLLLIPKFVNGAFSIELIIKAILTKQSIPYKNEHNLKVLFDLLPQDVQQQTWDFLVEKAPEYSNVKKREDEFILISEAFVQWRYCFEGGIVPAFDSLFLSVFANAIITTMFRLGYNTSIVLCDKTETDDEIERKFENNRQQSIAENLKTIQKKKSRGNS